MKIKIVIGCIAAVCLLLIIPSIPAVDITNATEINRTQIFQDVKTIDYQELKRKLQTIDKKELRQKIVETISKHKDEISLNQGLMGFILMNLIAYILNFIFVIIWWILAIPQILLLGIWVIAYYIVESLGLIPHY